MTDDQQMKKDRLIDRILRYADGKNNRIYKAFATRDSKKYLHHFNPTDETIEEIYKKALETDHYPFPETISYLVKEGSITYEEYDKIKHNDMVRGNFGNMLVYKENGLEITYKEAEIALDIALNEEKHYMDPEEKETYLNNKGFFKKQEVI